MSPLTQCPEEAFALVESKSIMPGNFIHPKMIISKSRHVEVHIALLFVTAYETFSRVLDTLMLRYADNLMPLSVRFIKIK